MCSIGCIGCSDDDSNVSCRDNCRVTRKGRCERPTRLFAAINQSMKEAARVKMDVPAWFATICACK